MSIDRIEMFCDNPRHVEPIETFGYSHGWWWIDEGEDAGATPDSGHHPRRGAGERVHRFECYRCAQRKVESLRGDGPQGCKPRYSAPLGKKRQGLPASWEIECTESTLQWLLNAVAGQGVSQPTLRMLNVILSKRT